MTDTPQTYTAFKPPFWLRPAMVQTLVASLKFRKRGLHVMENTSKPIILECEDGIRLQGSFTHNQANRALVIFLHGWEGSEESTYVMSCARHMFDRGCSVFRLNFRDHGDTHHLNEAPFHAQRLAEVVEAVQEAARLAKSAPVYIVGFSLGGNFALRIASQLKKTHIDNLQHVFAISPVIDPWKASPMVDDNPLIKRYFYKKWTTSLTKKQKAFPHLYDFSEIMDIKTVMGISEKFLPRYTEFETPEHYFTSYAVGATDLNDCPVPVSLIMAADDPVVPACDVNNLEPDDALTIIMHENGGHNGFFQSLTGPTWYDAYIERVIDVDTRML